MVGPPGGDGFTIGPMLSLNLYGPNAVDGVISYLQGPNFVPPPPLGQFLPCGINTSFVLEDATGTGNISWPVPACNLIVTTGTTNLADQCPTDFAFCNSTGVEGGYAFDGKPFNQSNCDQCSGLGQCITGYRTCACDPPTTTGLFAGITMISGPDCGVIRSEYTVSAGLNGFLYFLSAFSILLSIVVALWFYLNRDQKVVKRAAFTFLQIATLGGFLGAISCVAIIVPTSNATCEMAAWLGNFGWVLMFGALFVKTWRLYSIFGNKMLKTVVLTDKDMILRLVVIFAVELILRSFENAWSPIQKTAKQLGNCAPQQTLQQLLDPSQTVIPSDFQYFFTCSSSYYSQIDTFSWAYKGAFTAWGCFLAYKIKDIQEDWNESKLLALTIYNMTVFAIIAKVIILFVGASSPSITLAVEVLAVNYVIICTLIGISVPKYILIRRGVTISAKSTASKGAAESTAGKGTGATGGITGHGGGGIDDEHTQNITMNPAGASQRVTPPIFAKTLETIRNRMRTSATDRANELSLFLEHAQQFVAALDMLKSSSATTYSNTFQGRPTAPSLGYGGRPASSSTGGANGGGGGGTVARGGNRIDHAGSSGARTVASPVARAVSPSVAATRQIPSPSLTSRDPPAATDPAAISIELGAVGASAASSASAPPLNQPIQTESDEAPVLEKMKSSSRSDSGNGRAEGSLDPNATQPEGEDWDPDSTSVPPPPVAEYPYK